MRRLIFFNYYAYVHQLTRCLLPPPPSFSLDKELVGDDEEGIDDADAVADTTAPEDVNFATMPPKVKPLLTKPTKKDSATAVVTPPPPWTSSLWPTSLRASMTSLT
jgi:hypothetical protein